MVNVHMTSEEAVIGKLIVVAAVGDARRPRTRWRNAHCAAAAARHDEPVGPARRRHVPEPRRARSDLGRFQRRRRSGDQPVRLAVRETVLEQRHRRHRGHRVGGALRRGRSGCVRYRASRGWSACEPWAGLSLRPVRISRPREWPSPSPAASRCAPGISTCPSMSPSCLRRTAPASACSSASTRSGVSRC